MTKSPSRRDPLGRLADALVEDILATREAELFAECEEDHGDARALSAEADKIIDSIIGKDRAQPGVKTYDQPTWSTLTDGDRGAAPAVAERTAQARILGWPLVGRKPGAGFSGRLIGRNTRSESFVRLAEFWRRRISADRSRFARRFQIAVAAVVGLIAVSGTVALYRADHVATGSSDEFTRATSSVNEPLPRELELRVSPPVSKGTPAVAGDPTKTVIDARRPEDHTRGYLVKFSWQPGQSEVAVSYLHTKFPRLAPKIDTPAVFLVGLTSQEASNFCAGIAEASGVECIIRPPAH